MRYPLNTIVLYCIVVLPLSVTGVGAGLLYTPTMVAVGQHFEKKRGLANGISLAGSGIGSIAIPPAMVYALNTYGLEGTLLIMGGMALNLCVSGMLFRPPSFYMRRFLLKMERRRRICMAMLHAGTKQIPGDVNSDEISDVAKGGCVNPIAMEDICLSESCPHNTQSAHKDSPQANIIGNGANGDRNDFTKVEWQPNYVVLDGCHPDKAHDKVDTTTEQLRSDAIISSYPTKQDAQTNGVFVVDVDGRSSNGFSPAANANGTSCCSEDQSCPKPPLFQYRILTHPVFLIYCATIALAGNVYFGMFIMATPHAEQLGFSQTKAALLVSIMGGADMISRVGFGIFADSKIIKTQHMFHGSLALSTVVLFILPSLKTYPAVASALVLFAVAGGGIISLLPTLLAETLGIERLPATYGVSTMTIGFTSLVLPAVMGKCISICQ